MSEIKLIKEKSAPGPKTSRRDFLKTAWGMMGGVVALEFGGLAAAYLQPRVGEGEFGGLISAGNVEDFPPGSVTHFANGRFYLARQMDGGFLALYQRCTHLGCNVPWDQTQGQFVCPCHSSQFDLQGQVLNPPAARPLYIFPVLIQEGIVKVDTSNPVSRQTVEPDQAVYP